MKGTKPTGGAKIPSERIERAILLIRGHKVMLDADLAELYGVPTKILNKAVGRNLERFPSDFMFRLTREEADSLRFHFGTSSWGGKRYLPYAFTQEGVAMLSGILTSKRAIHVNIIIMRTFVRLRQILSTHKELAHKLKELEGKIEKHDTDIQAIFEAIRQLMAPPPAKPKQRIGFRQE